MLRMRELSTYMVRSQARRYLSTKQINEDYLHAENLPHSTTKKPKQ